MHVYFRDLEHLVLNGYFKSKTLYQWTNDPQATAIAASAEMASEFYPRLLPEEGHGETQAGETL